MTGSPVMTAEEVSRRLAALCLGGARGFPKKSRDRHILLAAATLWMEPGAVYTEREVNDALAQWLEEACPALAVDVVSLRRELVDFGYLDRDDSGTHYSGGPGPAEWRFADDVADVDPIDVMRAARAEREARRRAYEASRASKDEE
ncbi:MAG TPA: DUF2087 domain-containing protein [Acidimicrobiia bacterium]